MRTTVPVALRRALFTLVLAAPIAAVTVTASSGAAAPAPPRGAAAAVASPVTFRAVDDTQLNSSAPNTTYGGGVKMAVCGAGAPTCSVDGANEKRALVKFTVADTVGTVTSAKLRYYAVTTPVPALSVRRVTDNSWTEATATWNKSNSLPTAPAVYSSPAGSTTGYYEADVTTAVTGNGTYSFVVTSASATTLRLATKESTAPVAPPQLVVATETGTPGDPVLVAAGDISTRTKVGGNKQTSDLVLALSPDKVLTLGDDQYPDGALIDYQTYYQPTWGRFKAKTDPVPGNHEYLADTSASGYFTYFGAAASPLEAGCTSNCNGYYSFDIGAWHFVVLNTNHNDCAYVACDATSAQLDWLRNDLANTTQPCLAAAFHHPRWSSGTHHGSDPTMGPIWTALYQAKVDVVINGHEHNYERFAKQNPSGQADPQGIRQFVVGTGGNGLYGFGTPAANSQARNSTSKGVLQLTLHATGYDWAFKPAAGFTFADAGSDTCN